MQKVLITLKNGWNVLVQDESIFIYDLLGIKKKKWIIKENRPIVTVTGSHSKTIIFGVLSKDGKQLFRQYDRFDSHSFITYLEEARKKFKKFVIFVDRATQHRSKRVKEYLKRNEDCIRIEYFLLVHLNSTQLKNAGDRESTICYQTIILVFLTLNK